MNESMYAQWNCCRMSDWQERLLAALLESEGWVSTRDVERLSGLGAGVTNQALERLQFLLPLTDLGVRLRSRSRGSAGGGLLWRVERRRARRWPVVVYRARRRKRWNWEELI